MKINKLSNDPNSECNNPNEYDKLRDWQKQGLQEWITECVVPYRIKNFNPYYSSYGLKHLFQYSIGFYVTNGQFKGAMLKAGFEPENYDTKNWVFQIGKRLGTINRKR